jgi:hypothetical protein
MAEMHLCSCEVAIAGDTRNTVLKQGVDAVTFPETQVLRVVHGTESVQNIKVIGSVESDPAAEKARLLSLYPPEAVEYVYPGFTPVIPMTMPGAAPAPAKAKSAAKTVEVAAEEETI